MIPIRLGIGSVKIKGLGWQEWQGSNLRPRFWSSVVTVLSRFVLYQDVPDYWEFLAAITSVVSANTVLCYRVR
jgi:hypothetical protein